MNENDRSGEDQYEIIIKKSGKDELVEINIMGDRETREVLQLIGRLNLRSAFASSMEDAMAAHFSYVMRAGGFRTPAL